MAETAAQPGLLIALRAPPSHFDPTSCTEHVSKHCKPHTSPLNSRGGCDRLSCGVDGATDSGARRSLPQSSTSHSMQGVRRGDHGLHIYKVQYCIVLCNGVDHAGHALTKWRTEHEQVPSMDGVACPGTTGSSRASGPSGLSSQDSGHRQSTAGPLRYRLGLPMVDMHSFWQRTCLGSINSRQSPRSPMDTDPRCQGVGDWHWSMVLGGQFRVLGLQQVLWSE